MAKTKRPKPTVEEKQGRSQDSIAPAPSKTARPYDGKVLSASEISQFYSNLRKFIQFLRREGWRFHPSDGKGSHIVFKHPNRPNITIPYCLKLGTFRSILYEAGYIVR